MDQQTCAATLSIESVCFYSSWNLDVYTDMAKSTRLLILIKNIYTLYSRKRFLLPVTYFSSNLEYPFTKDTRIIILASLLLLYE